MSLGVGVAQTKIRCLMISPWTLGMKKLVFNVYNVMLTTLYVVSWVEGFKSINIIYVHELSPVD